MRASVHFLPGVKSRFFVLSFSYVLLFTSFGLLLAGSRFLEKERPDENEAQNIYAPNDQFFFERTYPDQKFALQAYTEAMQKAMADYRNAQDNSRGGTASWVLEGPTNIGGRVNTIAVDPDNTNIIMEGCASGGIFKSTDGGLNWYPVFDDFSYLAISCIVYDPTNSNIVYAGTGDANISGYPFIGDGIYKSVDGGETWTNIGLNAACIISKIIVHPADHNTIYAASMGLPFERNYDRGLYKSTDAGLSWTQILSISDQAGVIDIASDPTDPDKIYAAGWDRIRNNTESTVYGNGSKIYRSNNGGTSWTSLDEDNGLPEVPNSRISIEMDPGNPSVLYASYVGTGLGLQGIYKTTNGGTSWSSIPIPTDGGGDVMGNFGWYFDGIQLNPYNTDELFVEGVDLWVTNNDGDDWNTATPPWWVYSVHADKHAMTFIDDNSFYLCTDGGLYKTNNDADSWTDADEVPNSQFYYIEVNPHTDGIYWGGLQDNGTVSGNASSIDSWPRIFGGDGFHTEFRSDDPNIYYAETQNCGIAVWDGTGWYDATVGIDLVSDRTNWNTPYMISKFDDDVLFAATYRFYKSTDGIYPNFTALSSDLTDGVPDLPMFHTCSVIEQSDFNANVIYVGTSDGRVQRSSSGGTSFSDISSGLPDRYVTDIAVSHTNANTVFAANSGYRDNDFIPHIHRSDNNGLSWTDISGDLPALAVNQICVYPTNDTYIFVATDGGVYYTLNNGVHWDRLGDNMPVFPVYDLEYDQPNNKIIAGTFARSCWSISIDGLIPLSITASADTTICAGGTATLSAFGGMMYTWSPDATCMDGPCSTVEVSPLTTTTYTVTGYDGVGGTATETITVNVVPLPETPVITLSGGIISSSMTGSVTYQWYNDDGPIPGETGITFSPPTDEAGNYYLVVTNAEGCSSVSSNVISIQLSVDDINTIHFSVLPDPVADELLLSVPEQYQNSVIKYTIFDVSGKRVMQGNYNAAIPVKNLSAAVYFIRIDAEDKIGLQRFVKL